MKWVTSTLGELFEIARGGSPRPIKDYVTTAADGINWIRIGDAGRDGKYIWSTEQKIKPAGMRRSRFVKNGDFILSNSMSFGRPYILRTDGCIHDGWLLLRPRAAGIDENFLYYALSSNVVAEQFERLAAGSVVRNLNADSVRSVSIAVPPLPEQRRIVGILDEAFAGIATAKANAEKNLRNARELFETELQAVFNDRADGWEDKPLGAIAEFKNGLNFSQSSKGQSVRVVGVGNFSENYVVPLADLQSVTIDADLDENYEIRENDLLTVRSNGSKDLVGRCMLVPAIDEPISYSGFVIRIRPDSSVILPQFLLHFMKSSDTRDRLTKGGGGANISNINQGKLSALEVPLPPLSAQRAIVSTIDRLREETQRLASVYQQKLAALEALKKALLHQAFSANLGK